MSNKLYNILETLGTISWLLMDFCWMSDYFTFALIFSCVAVMGSLGAFIVFSENNNSEKMILGGSWIWIMMNSAWMCGDIFEANWLIILAKILFVIAFIIVLLAICLLSSDTEPDYGLSHILFHLGSIIEHYDIDIEKHLTKKIEYNRLRSVLCTS